jgi:hypothetical protein
MESIIWVNLGKLVGAFDFWLAISTVRAQSFSDPYLGQGQRREKYIDTSLTCMTTSWSHLFANDLMHNQCQTRNFLFANFTLLIVANVTNKANTLL